MLTIYCDVTAKFPAENTVEILYTQSFLTCLSLAEIHFPDLICLRFSYGTVQQHEKHFELCGCLKKDKNTKNIPIIAILSYPNRELISTIKDAGVEFISCFAGAFMSHKELNSVIAARSDLQKSNNYYNSVCPFLDYKLYDDDEHEIILCGAYNDRKVISSHLLNDICCNAQHQKCSLFLNPKVQHEIF